MRVSMHVPKSSLRTRDNLSHKGWIKRRGGYGIFGKWKRQFLSLWRDSILYFHRDDASSDKFYNGNKSKNNAKGEINLRDIVGVRMVTKKGLPGDGRGIELVSSSGKVTTICPEGGGNIFMDWYNKLRNVIGNLNRGRYQRTGDPEYRKDVSEINPRQFGKGTMNDIQSSLNDVDSYNVDVWDLDESKSSDYNIGMFDEDRGYIFSYTEPNIEITGIKKTAFLIRLAPSVSNAIIGDLGERELLNRAQLLLQGLEVTSEANATGSIVIEGILNPQNYPTNPALIS